MALTFEQSKCAPTSTTETSPNYQSISLDALSQQQLKATPQQDITTPVVTSHSPTTSPLIGIPKAPLNKSKFHERNSS